LARLLLVSVHRLSPRRFSGQFFATGFQQAQTESIAMAKKSKYVYFFGGGKSEGDASMKQLLGGFCWWVRLEVIARCSQVVDERVGQVQRESFSHDDP